MLELAFSILYDPDETLNFIAPNKYEVRNIAVKRWNIQQLTSEIKKDQLLLIKGLSRFSPTGFILRKCC